jgi:hypothetical protein
MKNSKKSLLFGVIIGLVLAFLYCHYFAPRYEVKKSGTNTIKVDRWTGQSWRLESNSWKKMLDADESWEEIDSTLQEALNIPFAQVDSGFALNKLREKYPVLNDISDDELMERIKLVYSKMVLVNMYLGDFIKANEGNP